MYSNTIHDQSCSYHSLQSSSLPGSIPTTAISSLISVCMIVIDFGYWAVQIHNPLIYIMYTQYIIMINCYLIVSESELSTCGGHV